MSEFYDSKGSVGSVESVDCVAKKVGNFCYLRVSRAGQNVGKLFNPKEDDASLLNRSSKATMLPMYQFFKANKTAYENYIKFLETKNTGFLSVAEREMRNG